MHVVLGFYQFYAIYSCFLEFPETAWRSCTTRQAMHAPKSSFWAFSINCLMVVCCR